MGWIPLAEALRSRKKANPELAAFGMIVFGTLLGFLTSLVLPQRLFGVSALRGASIVVSPLVTGFVMKLYGSWSEKRGREHSYFATFWGGALFALSMATVRFAMVGGNVS